MAYGNDFASVYDAFTQNVSYGERALYITGLLRNKGIKNGILLDLACGTGSFSAEFSKRGYDVVGVDISPDMLMRAKQKAEEEKLNILFLCQDISELDLYGTVDCAVCCLDSINHLEDFSAVCRTFERVSLFMRPGGVFVFDVNTLYKHKKILSGKTFVYENDESVVLWQNSECENGSVNLFLDVFTKDIVGSYDRQSEQFTETAYKLKDIKKALSGCGFSDISVYEDMKKSKPTPHSERVYFVAVKNSTEGKSRKKRD